MMKGEKVVVLVIRVIPRAKKNGISEILDDGTIKIRLTAPPTEGKANMVLIEFLADLLDVSVSKIEIVKGEKSRMKLVTIQNIDPDTVDKKIRESLDLKK